MTDARNPLIFAASVLALILVWQGAAILTADPLVLPSPLRVATILWGEAVSGTLWRHIVPTLLRVAAAFTLAMVLGSALGLVLGLMPRVNRWADPWVVVFLNMPALVVIVLCYLWIGLNETAAIVAVAANKAAAVLVTVREGARALDPAVAEMARVYRMSPLTRLRHVILPQLAPFFAAAARGGLSIIWKLVLVVELLGRPNGIGFQIHLYFQLFEVGHVIAYALSFIGVMLLIEYALIQPAEQRASRWRRRIA